MLSFDTLKTGVCKPARAVREGCGSPEPGVCSFVLGTYPQRGSVPPPPPPQGDDSVSQSMIYRWISPVSLEVHRSNQQAHSSRPDCTN